MRPLIKAISGVTRPLMTPQKALWAGLCLNWSKIVSRVARTSSPLKFQWMKGGGTLWIGVWGGQTFLISHETAAIIEAVNRYAGYKAIGRVKYKEIQKPCEMLASVSIFEISPKAHQKAEHILKANDSIDDCLSKALLSLGACICQKSSGSTLSES